MRDESAKKKAGKYKQEEKSKYTKRSKDYGYLRGLSQNLIQECN